MGRIVVGFDLTEKTLKLQCQGEDEVYGWVRRRI